MKKSSFFFFVSVFLKRLIYFQACLHEDNHNSDSLKNYLHSFTVFQLWSGPWSSEGVGGLCCWCSGGELPCSAALPVDLLRHPAELG